MDPSLFLTDLAALPATLEGLAGHAVEWPLAGVPPRRLILTGMGSSWFAARIAATRLRALGIDAVAERSSAVGGWPPDGEATVVAISASGGSAETLAFAERHAGRSRVIALTNSADSPLSALADATVPMHAGVEAGGVACRSYHHTLVALLDLAARWGAEVGDRSSLIARTVEATADLLDRRGEWVEELATTLAGPHGLWLLAPEERLGNALQGALMVREGPRRPADACETGDWSHVDVYLTKTLDYRALVFPGSRWDTPDAEWLTQRRSTVVAVGGDFPNATRRLRYLHGDDPLVAELVEVLVPSLIAAHWWS